MSLTDETWVPGSCALPTVDRPLRMAEFDDLFATALRGQARPAPAALIWDFAPKAAARVRELIERESACCRFFVFTVSASAATVRVEVAVPEAHVDVLDALAGRAARSLR
ncbi:hypothetical protein [Micromonospora siamensis]|uniref:Uncharacterized protein n=1 Tax=Micromonospora siamensis TaxID=299152 RepID=A0A1C5IGZ3_9ACTN|nr:hypothetical protein [Micromonospora siamensis]SCG57534.1 hypothetical protein GA0074704_3395 [Micromonospora siamensis]